MRWENVHVFISSTFNDMHAERDYLVKKVFPQLAAWCEERKLRLIDIDLRWGVSEADATENKRVVQVCLDRIDACRPFFLCFLGQRRGWVPEKDDISAATYADFPGLAEKYAGKTSVTELEILHALIDPLRGAHAAEHTFFYLRDPGYLPSIHGDKLLDIYTNRAERDPADADAYLAAWREDVIPATGRPAYAYTAEWNEAESTHEIALPLYCPTTAPAGSQTWKAAFARWAAMWKAAGVTVGENGEITDPAELRAAKAYNESFTRGRLTAFRVDGRDLADVVIEDLKQAITARFGERMREAETPLQKEMDQQAQFLQVASEGFIKRTGDFDAIHAYLSGNDTRPFAVTAFSGMGKTSLLAHCIDTYAPEPGETLHYRFIGAGDESVSIERLIRSLLEELQASGKMGYLIPEDSAEMMRSLPTFLAEAGRQGKTILVVDALNQLEGGMDRENLSWIPLELPPRVKLILSFKRGEEKADAFYSEQEKNNAMLLHGIRPFDDSEDRRKLVTAYLERYFKELDDARIEALIHSSGAENPLFLKVALSELRVFGVHSDLTAMIRDNFGDTPVKAFDAILARMETDPAYSRIAPGVSLPHLLGWLAHSLHGLAVEELADLLVREKLTDNENDARDAIYLVLRQLRPYFARRDGRVDFFYDSFKTAATARYTQGHRHARPGTGWHRSLAEYFGTKPVDDRHKLMEQAYQYAHAGMARELEELLWDYSFLRARLHAGGTPSVMADCGYAALPEAGLLPEAAAALENLAGFFRMTAHIFAEDAHQLPSQLWAVFAGTASPRLRALLDDAARLTTEPWLRPRFPCLDPPGGPLVRTFSGHANHVSAACFSPDGTRMFSAAMGEVKMWDVETGACLATFAVEFGALEQLFYIPGTHQLIARDRMHTLYLWDVRTGRQLFAHDSDKPFNPFTMDMYYGLALSADGNTVATHTGFGKARFWKLPEMEHIRTFRAHWGGISHMMFSADGSRLLTRGGLSRRVKIWDVRERKKIRTFTTRIGSECALSADGKFLLSAGGGAGLADELLLWDVTRPKPLKTIANTLHGAHAAAFGIDGKTAFTGTFNGRIGYWDLEKGEFAGSVAAHSAAVTVLAPSPDGRCLLSGSKDFSLKLWDVSKLAGRTAASVYSGKIASVDIAGGSVATSADSGGVRIWDLRTGEETWTKRPKMAHHSCASALLTEDGKRLLFKRGSQLRMLDLETGRVQSTRNIGMFHLTSCVMSRDGKVAAVPHAKEYLIVFNPMTGKDIDTGAGLIDRVWRLDMTPDGRVVVCSVLRTGGDILVVLDLEKKEKIEIPTNYRINDVSVHPDGRSGYFTSRHEYYCWDTETKQAHPAGRIYTPRTGLETSHSLVRAFGRDEYFYACGEESRWLKLCRPHHMVGTVARIYLGSAPVAMDCTPDGNLLVAGGEGGMLYYLQLENAPWDKDGEARLSQREN